ncbi:tetratricopeptide repeat protein, partial [bacterium]|nr:tetratricopeptide repeat protein [bacterium]
MRGIVIFLLFFNLIWADTVILKNGSVYEGRIIKETEKMIIIKTEVGEIGIPRDKIKEIEYEWVKEGEKEYKKGNWEEAAEIFEKYIEKEKGKTKDKEKAIFKIGMCYMKLNEKEKALKKFLHLLKEYPETEYRESAELEIGKTYYGKGEKEKAKEIFEKLKGSWDRKIKAEAEYYLFVLNPPETEEEKEEFYNNYITRYPESPYISEILYQKAEILYNRMENREKYTIKNIPQYREIKELLEKAKEKTENPETLKKIYPLLITCYDHLAEYRKKHQTMKEYAQLLYPEDREKQAEWMKQQADRLITEGETAE